MIRQSPSRDRGSDGAVSSVQRDVNESSGGTTQGSRGFDEAVSPVQRDVHTSRDTIQRSRVSDGAVSLVQRNIVVAFRGIKTNDHKSFILTPETEKAFEELKTAFTTTPILKHFNPELPTRIETNASGYAIDDILNQFYEGV